jgi:hypothetical protein
MRATEDIAAIHVPSGDAKDEKFFELVVDPDGSGIDADEEILISYSNTFPNEPFLMYFGFVPDNNQNDAVVLFDRGVDDLLAHARDVMGIKVDVGTLATVRDIFGEHADAKISCTIDAVDARLIDACERVLRVPWMDVVASRAKTILTSGRFSTKIRQDIELLRSGTLSPNATLAVRFRLAKKAILIAPLGQTLEQYYP